MKKSFLVVLTLALCPAAFSQPVAAPAAPITAVVRTNTAIVPAERGDERGRARTQEVLKRAKDAPGNYDIAFIGDSITQGWERSGKSVWDEHFGPRRCINFGVGGDRTQHVLWRLRNGELTGISPKVAVLMIGTNNSKDDQPEAIADAIRLIVQEIRTQCPRTKVLLLAVFPRNRPADTSEQLATNRKVNKIIAKLGSGRKVRFLDINKVFLGPDGKVPADIMPDFLHPNEHGYQLWAEAMEPTLAKMMK